MSEKIMTMQQWLSNFFRSDLSQNFELTIVDIAVLHALASYCYYRSECNPTQSALSHYNRGGKEAIQHSLQRLEENGLIEIIRRNGARNIYKLTIPRVTDEEIYHAKKIKKPAGKTSRLNVDKESQDLPKPAGKTGWLN